MENVRTVPCPKANMRIRGLAGNCYWLGAALSEPDSVSQEKLVLSQRLGCSGTPDYRVIHNIPQQLSKRTPGASPLKTPLFSFSGCRYAGIIAMPSSWTSAVLVLDQLLFRREAPLGERWDEISFA
jgi:hypothetical protein